MNKAELIGILIGLDVGTIGAEMDQLADRLLNPGQLHDVDRLSRLELRLRAIDVLRQMRLTREDNDSVVRAVADEGRLRNQLRDRLQAVLGINYHDASMLLPPLLADGPDLEEMLACSDADLFTVVERCGGILGRLTRRGPLKAIEVPMGGWFTVPTRNGGQEVFQRVPPPADAATRTTVAQVVDWHLDTDPDEGPPSIWVKRCFDGHTTSRAYPLREIALVFPMRG